MPNRMHTPEVERLAQGVIDHLDKEGDCESCRATILIEALARITLDGKISPYHVMEHFIAEFLSQARVGMPLEACEAN